MSIWKWDVDYKIKINEVLRTKAELDILIVWYIRGYIKKKVHPTQGGATIQRVEAVAIQRKGVRPAGKACDTTGSGGRGYTDNWSTQRGGLAIIQSGGRTVDPEKEVHSGQL